MEPRVILQSASGVRETYERTPDDPGLWQEIHGETQVRHGEPITADELLERVRAMILGEEPPPG